MSELTRQERFSMSRQFAKELVAGSIITDAAAQFLALIIQEIHDTKIAPLQAELNRRADMLTTLAAENDLLRAENEELDFLRHEGGPDSVAAMEIELATLRAERDAWTKIDVARDVDFATLRTSEAAALERITELEALLAASTHSPRLPE